MHAQTLAALATLLRYFAGCRDRFLFFLPNTLVFGLNFSLGAYGIAVGYRNAVAPGWHIASWWELALILLTIATLVQLVIFAAASIWAARFDLVIGKRDDDLQKRLLRAYRGDAGHTTIQWKDQAFVYENGLWPLLDKAATPVEINKHSYSLPRPLNEWKLRLLAKAPECQWDTFNNRKIRLQSSISKASVASGETVRLQKTRYYFDRITNNIALNPIRIERLPVLPLFDWVTTSDGTLKSFDQSVLSNQLGGSTLLFTADRKIIYVQQGHRSDANRNKLAPTGSGSFDWIDLQKNSRTKNLTFQNLAKLSIYRELVEEVGLKEQEVDCLHRIVGFGRYLYRAGKPEVFSVICANTNFHSLSVRVAEWELVNREILAFELDDNISKKGLLAGINGFIQELERATTPVSGPLYFNAKLVAAAFEDGLAEEIAHWFINNKRRALKDVSVDAAD